MDALILTAKELMYAAFQLGADRFFGLPDPFYGMEPEEIRREIGELQLSLEKKGYAQLGFDDVFALKAPVKEFLETTALCDRYVMLQGEGHDAAPLTVLYCREGCRALLRQDAQQLTLTEPAARDMKDSIARALGGAFDTDGAPQAVLLSEEVLTAAQLAAPDDPQQAQTLLTGQGCGEQTAALLVQGFRREIGFHLLCEGDLKRRSLRHLIVIGNGKARISLVPEDIDQRLWRVQVGVDASAVKRLLDGEEESV